MTSITAGQRLGHYELVSRIGAGGMGDVWKARDVRLDRCVAVKVSRKEFSDRFRREALAIARLNHPHVCTLHDVGPDYLVLEYVSGEPLQGPLPLDKLIVCAGQICDALEAAHKHGITHRDLKPGNILVTVHGIKLLDFGLARLHDTASADDETKPLTVEGTVLGTPAYMAPEQIEGGTVDARADIFALGCVIYELATGKRAFEGRTAREITAAVLTKEVPPPSAIAASLPATLDRIVAACLRKNPDERFQNARDVKLALEWVLPETQAARGAGNSRVPRSLVWAAAGILVLAAIVFPFLLARQTPSPEALRVPLATPGLEPAYLGSQMAVPSPDGTRVLWTVFNQARQRQLAVLSLASGSLKLLPGTEDVHTAFWSPDSREIAFYAKGKLRKQNADGGTSQTITQLSSVVGGSWSANGEMLLMTTNRGPLFVIPENGGPPTQVTTLDISRFENSHRNPSFLPDGYRFLFTARSSRSELNCLYLGDRRSKDVRRLAEINSNARFVTVDGDDGWLVYGRDQSLVARRWNARTAAFSGRERPVLERVGFDPIGAAASFRLSQNGRVLLYREAAQPQSEFRWFDRENAIADGRLLADEFTGQITQPRLSPDGRYVLFSRPDDRNGNRDLWLLDVERGTTSRLTSNPANDWWGVWEPRGQGIYFVTDRRPGEALFYKSGVDPTADEASTRPPIPDYLTDVSADGRWAVLAQDSVQLQFGIRIADLRAHTPAEALLDTEFDEPMGRLSADGRWLAYMSDDTGRYEVYLRGFRDGRLDARPRIAVSHNGGEYPDWDPKGNELFFLGFDRTVYSVHVGADGPQRQARPLFRACGGSGFFGEGTHTAWHHPYSVAPGGKRILFRCNSAERGANAVMLWRDWMSVLGR